MFITYRSNLNLEIKFFEHQELRQRRSHRVESFSFFSKNTQLINLNLC